MGKPRRAIVVRRKRWPWVVLSTVLVLILGVGAWVGVSAQNALDAATQGQGGGAADLMIAKPLNGEETGRVNILLVGSSFDDSGHDGAVLTDSIMVASMDLKTHDVVLVSIPRDLWVQYRGASMKINAVFPVAAGIPAGSADLGDWRTGLNELGLMAEDVTGLHINQHILVGYQALQEVVDAVGGIDVTIKSTDPRGIWDPNAKIKLPTGPQQLDGSTALALTRARNHPMPGERPYGIAGGDFDRAKNQQMVLQGVQKKVKESPALANPATVVQVFQTISRNVRMDLTVSQIRRVMDLGTASEKTKNLSVRGTDAKLLIHDAKVGGASVLVPNAGLHDYSAMRAYVAEACRPKAPSS